MVLDIPSLLLQKARAKDQKEVQRKMKKYELCVVYSPSLDEEALNTAKEGVKALIERFGGTVENVDDWGKKRLAYEIQKVNEGFYNFVTFSAETSAPAEIEARMRINEKVLRYLIVAQEEA